MGTMSEWKYLVYSVPTLDKPVILAWAGGSTRTTEKTETTLAISRILLNENLVISTPDVALVMRMAL